MKSYPVRAYLYSRFSSAQQRRGNSLARQTEFAHQFCASKGITLDETLTFTDAGVSGHKGKNHQTGSLGLFLKACEQGRIARGSYLIVENLDRLSRENPLDAVRLLHTLLKTYGITLVVVHPSAVLTADNFDMLQGVLAFCEFSRGHSESQSKSVRSKDNWKRKRDAIAGGVAMTSRTPSWIKLVGGKMTLDQARAKVVRQIFEWSAKGFGQRVITRKLAEAGTAPIGGASIWHESFIQKLLTSRTVLGEYQPCVHQEGVRVPAGEPIKNYYPAVVTPELWEQSRAAMRGRRHQRGRITRKVGNLFTGLVYEDGVRSHHHAKDRWGAIMRTPAHTSPGFKYTHFERVVLWFVSAIKVYEGDGCTYDTLKATADRLDASVRKLQAQIDADPGMADMLPTLAKWKKDLREAVEKMEAAAVPVQARHLHTVRLVEAMNDATGEKLETLRMEVRQAVRQVVERIDVTVYSSKRPWVRPEGDYLDIALPDPMPPAMRVHRVTLWLATGETHDFVYITFNNRLTGGAHMRITADREYLKLDGNDVFPKDPPAVRPPRANKRFDRIEQCRRLRDQGLSHRQIQAATGASRGAVGRYLKGYTPQNNK